MSWQFPEVATVRSRRQEESKNENVPLLWGWLAELRQSRRYDKLYAESVGLGITSTVRYHAARLCDLQREEMIIERELRCLLAEPKFAPYRTVFRHFGFGLRLQAILLSQIYPLENFLDADGKPETKIRKGRRSGKLTKRHLSLRRFQKALGVAPSEESSGDKSRKKIVGGSDLCRRALWQWVFTRLEPKHSRLKNEIGQALGEFLDTEKSAGRPVKLVRMRVAAKAVKLLFKELVKEIASEVNEIPVS